MPPLHQRRGGYEHAADVRLRDSQWRKPRLVKGAEREACITGRNYVCRACERKYRSLQGQLQVVEQQLSAEQIINALHGLPNECLPPYLRSMNRTQTNQDSLTTIGG